MQAMILAAGFGSRLLPHSLVKPKPLFPVLNRPLLLLVVQRLRNLGFDKIIVNCHHLGEQIQDALRDYQGVTVLREAVILGTGGGLRGALPYFRDEPLLITNGDIYHMVDLVKLYRSHDPTQSKVTLATLSNPRCNSVQIHDNRIVSFDRKADPANVTFTGIHVINPEILEPIAENRYSCIIEQYRSMLQQGLHIRSQSVHGCYWTDMGTPAEYLGLHEGLLLGTIPRWQEFGDICGSFCLAKNAQVHKSAQLHGWVCVAGACIGENVRLENSVVWDGVVLAEGSNVRNTIVSSNACLEPAETGTA